MDDGETAPPAAKKMRTMATPYMPQELVTEILARLPVESLVRFSCACKAWRSTISGDASFHRSHLRLQKPCLLLSPNTWFDHHTDFGRLRKVGLYRWEASHGTEAHLVHATYLPCTDKMYGLAHCDGLVLVPSQSTNRWYYPGGKYEGTVVVLNPAMRRVLKLPWSPGSVKPHEDPYRRHCDFLAGSHQAFGLGRDTRSNSYKVARFFYRTVPAPTTTGESYHYTSTSGDYQYHYTAGMEVFTIGIDQQWRETVAKPPYPAATRQTAIFFQGSLLWTVEQRALREPAPPPGFLRFNLADETFGLLPFPPPSKRAVTSFAELRGELCVARVHDAVEMWMCADVENPAWELRHEVVVPMSTAHLYPIGVVDGGDVVFNDKTPHLLRRYDLRTKTSKGRVDMKELRYYDPSTGTVEYQRKARSARQDADDSSFEYPLCISSADVIPYVPSLIPV